MPLSRDEFTLQLTASGLLDAASVAETLSKLPPDKQPQDGEALARELVKQKKLTKFQAEQIYLGKGKSLVLGNYTILDKLGQGGMGMVLKAEHKRMKRLVALKVMSPSAVKTPDALKRFHREVEAAAKLRHPNIVAADDADEAKGTHFLVMEYVEGSDLSALVKKNGPLSVEQAVQCILQAARGLEYAHEQGVVHRDIKPANLLLDARGTVKILDMGLARIEGDSAGRAELTSTGAVMGTVDYMAPEQALSTKTADARSDIYSLGISLWYLLAGKCAYDGDTLMAKLLAHRDAPIPSLCALRNEIPSSVDAVFQKMVAKQAQDRYQSMTDVIRDLTACQSGTALASTTSLAASGLPEDTNLMSFLNNLSGPSKSVTATRQLQPTTTHAAVDKTAEATMLTANAAQSTDPQTLVSVGLQARQKKRRSSKPAAASAWWQDRRVQIGGGAAAFLLLLVMFVIVRGNGWISIRDKDGNEVAQAKEPKVESVEAKSEISNLKFQDSSLKSSAPPTKPIFPKSVADLPRGFVPLFNGKDLTGWKGEVDNPKKRAQMTRAELDSAQAKADQHMRAHWRVENGVLTFDGRGANLSTVQDYADFELYLEWNIPAGGDSGIYLRGAPQVQIWDSAARQHADNMGSGGLYNNRKHMSRPLLNADKPIGEWNAMFIRMVGEYVTVVLNGQLVVDNVVYENFVEPEKPIYASGPIELQRFGSPLQFRNVLIRVLKAGATDGKITGATEALAGSITPADGWVDVTSLIDATADAIEGSWTRRDSRLSGGGAVARLRFPLRTIDAFEFRLHFTLPYHPNSFAVAVPVGPARTGFQIEGVSSKGNSYSYWAAKFPEAWQSVPLAESPIQTGAEQVVLIRCRPQGQKATLESELNGEKFVSCDAPVAGFQPHHFVVGEVGEIVVSIRKSKVTLNRVEWRQLSGRADLIRPADAARLAKLVTKSAVPPLAVVPFDTAQARAHQEAWARHLGTTVETTNSVGAKMILIPPGEFLMGSTDAQVAAALKVAEEVRADQSTKNRIQKSERPQHRVVITRPFLMGVTEVTVGQFKKFASASGHQTAAETAGEERSYLKPGYAVTDDSPVAVISWDDATAYCRWLSKQEQANYRLPTEAEWEYACRAGATTQYSFGDDHAELDQFAWFNKNAGGRSQPVGVKRPNSFGLFDMHGNVYEWCQDFFRQEWYVQTPIHDPIGPAADSNHVIRGGSWNVTASQCRGSDRSNFATSGHQNYFGFRVVRVLDGPPTANKVSPDRRAAEWVIAQRGEVTLSGRQGWVASVNELPEGDLEVRLVKFMRPLSGENADLVPLRELKHLVFVGIDTAHPTAAGIAGLERLPKLERVSCGGQPLSDEQVTALARLKNVTGLFLSEARLTPARCATLASSMPQLASLNLMKNPLLDDTALAPLGELRNLKKLQLQGTQVTATGVAALQKALPNCSIEWDGVTK